MPMHVPATEDIAQAAAAGMPLPIPSGGTGSTSAASARGVLNGTLRTDGFIDQSSTTQTKNGPLNVTSSLKVSGGGSGTIEIGRDILTGADGLRITSATISNAAAARIQSITSGLTFQWMSASGNGGAVSGGVGIGPITSNGEVNAVVVVKSISAANRVLIARAASGQTADLFRLEDSSQTALLRVAASGALVNTQPQQLASYTVATLPSAAIAGQFAYASNGRVGLEMAGAGTGCPVYSKAGAWMKFDTNTQVQA